MPRITSLRIYPIKGMRGESCAELSVKTSVGINGDRTSAILRRPAKDNPGLMDSWLPKTNFYVGMNTAKMVSLEPYNKEITQIGITGVFQREVGIPEEPSFVTTNGVFNLTDTEGPTVSLLNMATFRLFETFLHQNGYLPKEQSLNPQRFRMNLQIDDWEPFAELDLADAYPGTRQITIGSLRFEVHDACERCVAIQANPETGKNDLDLLKLLRLFMAKHRPGYKSPHRHHNIVMGLILKPLDSGQLKLGDELLT